MKIQQAHEKLIEIKCVKIPEGAFTEPLGITKQAVSQRFRKNSELTEGQLKQLEEYFQVNLSEPTPTIHDKNDIPDELGITENDWNMITDLVLDQREVFLLMCKKLKSDPQAVIKFLFG